MVLKISIFGFFCLNLVAEMCFGLQECACLVYCNWFRCRQLSDSYIGYCANSSLTQPFIPSTLFKLCLENISFLLGNMHACKGTCRVYACVHIPARYIVQLSNSFSQYISIKTLTYSSLLPIFFFSAWLSIGYPLLMEP